MEPIVHWKNNPAFDFFVSLFVINHPESFGLRGSWAAGVRSRLSSGQREFLETTQFLLPVPLCWLSQLPASCKDSGEMLELLSQIPPEGRLPALSLEPATPPEVTGIFQRIASEHTWTPADQEKIRAYYVQRLPHTNHGIVQAACEAWSDSAGFGERYLKALREYYDSFFKEEEACIQGTLVEAIQNAQELARTLSLDNLIENLSRGVRFESLGHLREITLVPSYWATPLIFYTYLDERHMVMVFGAREDKETVIPGEYVPSDMLEVFKAVADPTRLRIIKYLSQSPQTPSELSRLLRLRPPTVIHHLRILRLAEIVQITLQENNEKKYTLRRGSLLKALQIFRDFLDIHPTETGK